MSEVLFACAILPKLLHAFISIYFNIDASEKVGKSDDKKLQFETLEAV